MYTQFLFILILPTVFAATFLYFHYLKAFQFGLDLDVVFQLFVHATNLSADLPELLFPLTHSNLFPGFFILLFWFSLFALHNLLQHSVFNYSRILKLFEKAKFP